MDAAGAPAVERVKPPELVVRLANPVLRLLLASPLHRPVGYHHLDGPTMVFTNLRRRLNLRGGADVEVTFHGAQRPARATLTEEPAEAVRRSGLSLVRLNIG